MQQLLKFYTTSLLKVAGLVVLAPILVNTLLVPYLIRMYGQGKFPEKAASFLTSGSSIAIVLAASEWLIRTKLWKVFHPELNFSGQWQGVSTYTHVHVGNGPVGHSVNHQARIEQDCLSIRLIPAVGPRYSVFKSNTVNLVDQDKLVYAYEVRYLSAKGDTTFPDATYGYEELEVVDPSGVVDPGKKVRPTEMNGWFAHCAKGQTPVYSGLV